MSLARAKQKPSSLDTVTIALPPGTRAVRIHKIVERNELEVQLRRTDHFGSEIVNEVCYYSLVDGTLIERVVVEVS